MEENNSNSPLAGTESQSSNGGGDASGEQSPTEGNTGPPSVSSNNNSPSPLKARGEPPFSGCVGSSSDEQHTAGRIVSSSSGTGSGGVAGQQKTTPSSGGTGQATTTKRHADRARFSQQQQHGPTSTSTATNQQIPGHRGPKLAALLLNELKLTLGLSTPLQLFFSYPALLGENTAVSGISAGVAGTVSSDAGSSQLQSFQVPQFSCLCRVILTATDIFIEQVLPPTANSTSVGSRQHHHGSPVFTLGDLVAPKAHGGLEAAVLELSQEESRQGPEGNEDMSCQQQKPLDVLCVPRASLLTVQTVDLSAQQRTTLRSSTRGYARYVICLQTRSFQSLFLLCRSAEDQLLLLEELTGCKKLVMAHSATLQHQATTTAHGFGSEQQQPRDSSLSSAGVITTVLPCSPVTNEPHGFHSEALVVDDATKVAQKILSMSTQRSLAAATATISAMHMFPPCCLPLVNRSLAASFESKMKENIISDINPCWFACDMAAEFERQKFDPQLWRVTAANIDFKAAKARNRSRALVATYFHKATGASIVRASQPNTSDVILRSFVETASTSYLTFLKKTCPSSEQLQIFDLRHVVNAMANLFNGGGCEGSGVSYGGIGNIKDVRSSFGRLFSLLHPVTPQGQQGIGAWTTFGPSPVALAQTQWLDVVYTVISASLAVARAVSGAGGVPSVAVVHCSDGWDRTAQVCALAQILLDPFFRTIPGLCVVIDKDFVQFGHMFADRSCCFTATVNGRVSNHSSPIFLLFLDCLHCLVKQYPHMFEYTEDCLLLIADAFHSGLFGNFAYNNYQEVCEADATRTTLSLWSFLEELFGVGLAGEGSSSPAGTTGCSSGNEGTRSTSSPTTGEGANDPEAQSKTTGPPTVADPASRRCVCSKFINESYNEAGNYAAGPLLSDVVSFDVPLWKRFFLRYTPHSHPIHVPLAPLSTPLPAVSRQAQRSGSHVPPLMTQHVDPHAVTPETPTEKASTSSEIGTPTQLRGRWNAGAKRPLTPQHTKQLGLTARQTRSHQDLQSLVHQYGAGGSHPGSSSHEVTPSSPAGVPSDVEEGGAIIIGLPGGTGTQPPNQHQQQASTPIHVGPNAFPSSPTRRPLAGQGNRPPPEYPTGSTSALLEDDDDFNFDMEAGIGSGGGTPQASHTTAAAMYYQQQHRPQGAATRPSFSSVTRGRLSRPASSTTLDSSVGAISPDGSAVAGVASVTASTRRRLGATAGGLHTHGQPRPRMLDDEW